VLDPSYRSASIDGVPLAGAGTGKPHGRLAPGAHRVTFRIGGGTG
jgi:hypothetical protein